MSGIDRLQKRCGVTILEVLIASLLSALVAGSSMLAFVTSANMARRSVARVEGVLLAVQTIERNRNAVACDSAWVDVNCILVAQAAVPDPILPGIAATAYNSAIMPHIANVATDRQYDVVLHDCDGDLANGDCALMTVNLTWTPPS